MDILITHLLSDTSIIFITYANVKNGLGTFGMVAGICVMKPNIDPKHHALYILLGKTWVRQR